VVTRSAGHGLPRIQYLFIGSRLCFTLLSDLTSRLGPGASLSLHLHPAVKRTCTSKLSIMFGTPKKKGQPGEELPFALPKRGADRQSPDWDYGR
jgi:hypothetical protein